MTDCGWRWTARCQVRSSGLGRPPRIALVWDTAIGQSTVATGRVVANLFYRGLLLRTTPRLGDTLAPSRRW